jgi:hypothetical protein
MNYFGSPEQIAEAEELTILRLASRWQRWRCWFVGHRWEYTDEYGAYVECQRCGKEAPSFVQ